MEEFVVRKPPGEERRNWKSYALPGVFASLALIMNKGKRIEEAATDNVGGLHCCGKAKGKPNPK